jgi:hypothetical protein
MQLCKNENGPLLMLKNVQVNGKLKLVFFEVQFSNIFELNLDRKKRKIEITRLLVYLKTISIMFDQSKIPI